MSTVESSTGPGPGAGVRLWRGAFALGLCLGLGTTFSTGDRASGNAGERNAGPVCHRASTSLGPLLGTTRMLLLGEIHGSWEVPAYALQVICAASRLPEPVILGLEIWRTEQSRIDAYIHSEGNAADRSLLLAGEFWKYRNQDGRSSVAMLDLIDGVRQRVADGASVSVFCFDEKNTRPMDLRDYRMATRLLEQREKHLDARFIVLTGNVHARTRIGTPRNATLTPMGWHLAAAEKTLISLNARHTAGEFWVCNPKCGVQRLGGSGRADRRGVERFESRDRDGYDGVFDIGIPTASPPAAGAAMTAPHLRDSAETD